MDHMADQTYLLDFLVRLLRTHSPSGYTENAAQLVAREANRREFAVSYTHLTLPTSERV